MKKFFLTFLITFFVSGVYSQTSKVRIAHLLKSGVQYNFLIGEDQNLTRTTPQGLGSGIYDFSSVYFPIGAWIINPNKDFMGIGLAAAISVEKFRFLQHYEISSDYRLTCDINPEHHYSTSFFTRDQSKIVLKRLYLPLLIYFPVSKWFASDPGNLGFGVVPFFQTYLYGYHKLMYHDENFELKKVKTDSRTLANVVNKNSYGIRGVLKIKRFTLFAQYAISEFFSVENGFNVNEVFAGIVYFPKLSSDKDSELKDLDFKTTETR